MTKTLAFNGNCKLFEGINMGKESLNNLVDSREKEELLIVHKMLSEEGFNPKEYFLVEIPTNGFYCFDNEKPNNKEYHYFSVDSAQGFVQPSYLITKLDANGRNYFYCKTIQESIDLTEC